MTSDIEQEKRPLKRKVKVGLWVMAAGSLTMLLCELGLLNELGLLIGLVMSAVGMLVFIPAIRRLRRIGTPVSESERKRKLWPLLGVLALTFLFWGIFYSRQMPYPQLVFFWGLLTVMFSGLIIWSCYISKGWTK